MIVCSSTARLSPDQSTENVGLFSPTHRRPTSCAVVCVSRKINSLALSRFYLQSSLKKVNETCSQMRVKDADWKSFSKTNTTQQLTSHVIKPSAWMDLAKYAGGMRVMSNVNNSPGGKGFPSIATYSAPFQIVGNSRSKWCFRLNSFVKQMRFPATTYTRLLAVKKRILTRYRVPVSFILLEVNCWQYPAGAFIRLRVFGQRFSERMRC